MFGAEQRDIDQIAEYADSGIRQMVRTGSLAPIAGRGGLNKWLYDRWGNRGNALYTALGSLLTIALSGLLAWALDEPLVFPSLGATAFLFFETPMAEVASVRNTLIGHTVGSRSPAPAACCGCCAPRTHQPARPRSSCPSDCSRPSTSSRSCRPASCCCRRLRGR
jgi:hypothetical protein